MITGLPAEEAAALLPRLFNLCREAQSVAARAAFGLPLSSGWRDALCAEILREHVVKLCLKWPGLVSVPAINLPRDWQSDTRALQHALFGPKAALPINMAGFETWLRSGGGASPALRAIADMFQPGEAVRDTLPMANAQNMFADAALENSVAARCSDHPVLQGIEARWGRGPLWSATAVAVDLERLLDGAAPQLTFTPNQAVITAARGLYGVRARIEHGIVTQFQRVTPTDHLMAPKGALDQALRTLPPHKARALAPLLLSVMDPCFPVTPEDAKELTNA
jgi:hypothetical protein